MQLRMQLIFIADRKQRLRLAEAELFGGPPIISLPRIRLSRNLRSHSLMCGNARHCFAIVTNRARSRPTASISLYEAIPLPCDNDVDKRGKIEARAADSHL